MKTVTTKEELKQAIEAKEQEIIIVGKLAQQLAKQKKVSKGAKIGAGIGAVAAIAAAPFTGGASLIPGFAATAALSGGVVAIILAGIAAITGISIVAMLKDYTVNIEGEGGLGNGRGGITLTRK